MWLVQCAKAAISSRWIESLTEVEAGDVLALMSAGAYGFTMASNYNSRPLPAEVLVSGAEAKIVRRRQSYADLIDHEITEG